MLPDKLNTCLDSLDTMFAPIKQPFTPWPAGTDQWYEIIRADGTKLRYKSAMRKQTKCDNCGVGESEVSKSLDTFNDTRTANPTAASQLATSKRRSYRSGLAPRLGFTSPDSNISENQSSNANNLPGTEISKSSVPLASTVRPRVTFADQPHTTDADTASDSRRQRSSTQRLVPSSKQTSTQGQTNDLDPWVSGILKRATKGTGTSCAQETEYGQTRFAPSASFVS
jgi:hypothetical protein